MRNYVKRLGAGTPDSTKFLRGDQTWAAPSGGASILHQATVTLTDAQIKALGVGVANAVQIAAAPGAGKLVVVATALVHCVIVDDGSYSNIASPATVGLLVGSRYLWDVDVDSTGLLSNWGTNLNALARTAIQPESGAVNGALKVAAGNNPNGAFTDGHVDNSLKVSVAYYVLNTSTGLFE